MKLYILKVGVLEILFIIGEISSFLAATCLAKSTFGRTKKDIVKWQVVEQTFCLISNLSLGGYSGVIVNIVSLVRNILSIKGKFKKNLVLPFLLIIIIFGIIFNNHGWIGLIPLIATIEYTIVLGFYKKSQNVRLALAINSTLWAIYDFVIMSYPIFIMDLVVATLALANYIRYRKKTQSSLFNSITLFRNKKN